MDSVPEWIEAVATAGAFLAAVVAAALAAQTYRHDRRRAADDRERAEHDRARDDEERIRSRRDTAGGVAAWWAHHPLGHGTEEWGVLVMNASASPRFDVTVSVAGNRLPGGDRIRLPLLPPGYVFVQSMNSSDAAGRSARAWSLPIAVADPGDFEPLISAATKRVHSLEFTESTLGSRWSWTPASGLNEVERDPAGT